MSLTRIYVPLTPSMVRALADTREIAPAPIPAHAVTQRLERARPTADEEEREYAALSEAATWQRRGDFVTLMGSKPLRFRINTN